jgi:tetratricopeptide (TPR) repeat protein
MPATSSPELPLEPQLPTAKGPDLEWDLPDVSATREPTKPTAPGSAPPGFELDLPDLSGPGLPSPVPGAPGTSTQRGAANFPSLAAGLPSPSAELPAALGGLPSTPARSAAQAGLPSLSASLPSVSESLPARAAGLPSVLGGPFDSPGSLPPHPPPLASAPLEGPSRPPEAAGFGELDLELSPPAPPASAGSGFGDVELPPAQGARAPQMGAWDDGLDADPFGEAPIPSQGARAPAASAPAPSSLGAITRAGGGGTSYGEVNLDGGGADEVPLEEARRPPRDEDMEFGGLPEERAPALAAAPAAVALAPPPAVSPAVTQRSRWPLRVFGGLLVLAVGGGSLAFVPEIGPYGLYWIGDRVNAADHQRLLQASAADARRSFGLDTWPHAKAAVERLVSARAGAKRMHAFGAYAAFSCYLAELRFGSDPALDARAKVLLDEIGPREAAYLDLASTARLAMDGKLDAAISRATQIASARPRELEAQVLAAELLLRGKDAKAAEAAWARFAAVEPSARSAFGLARAKFAAGDVPGTESAIDRTLELSPGHVGARILKARLASRARAGEAAAITLLESVQNDAAKASPDELVVAETLLGDIQLSRSHVTLAISAYERATKLSPRAARALAGMGQALFQSGRFSEALARFEAASQIDPEDLAAQVGVAKSKLSLERIEEAAKILAALSAKHPQQPQVALWYGRTLEAAGDLDGANAVYRKAFESGVPPEQRIEIAIALATLQNQRGQAEAAQTTLAKAREQLPRSVLIYRALGELALTQNRPVDAVSELNRALAIDPEDLPARFQLGVALRRNQKYEDATQAFDAVAAIDKDYPGLALERGLIFEGTGKNEDALNAYEAALKKAPTDVNLMLRVGCARVAAGRIPEAEEILRKVLSLRPTSAETNHCLGRALLAAQKIPDAERLLDRALELDPSRAQYHLYAGWAANEAGNDAKAERELAAALAADSSLADAYWQRGILRARQRAGREAVADLLQALKLNPARTEAHAALADAYYDLGREHDALAEWAKAVEAHPENANWRFRYGKLLVTNQMNEAGRPHLEKAIESAEKSPTPPRWLWEAHHFLARALGQKKEAAPHWEQFLRLGPRDSPYRSEAKQALARLGKPWQGE